MLQASELRRRNRRAAGHFFDAGTMRMFDSRIESGGTKLPDGGCLFITSEQHDKMFDTGRWPRMYTVRVMGPDGNVLPTAHPYLPGKLHGIHDLEYQAHDTLAAARAALLRVAAAWPRKEQ